MLIAFDIGNTAVTYGVYQGCHLKSHGSMEFINIPKLINRCMTSGSKQTISVVISSVVPQKSHKLASLLRDNRGLRLYFAGKNLPVPIKNRYKSPKKVGIDRLVCAYGASQFHKPPFLVIDYGTAITFDYVSKSGAFEGGMIIPGPKTALDALLKNAALLPKEASFRVKNVTLLGETTSDCINSGIFHGLGAMTDGLIERFKQKYGPMKVIATGGFAAYLRPYIKNVDLFDPLLSVKSLFLLFREHNSKS